MEDYRRDKRRKLLTQTHEDRIKAIAEEEEIEPEETWGDSDEEVHTSIIFELQIWFIDHLVARRTSERAHEADS